MKDFKIAFITKLAKTKCVESWIKNEIYISYWKTAEVTLWRN